MINDLRTLEALLQCHGYQANYTDERFPLIIDGILPERYRLALPQVQGSPTGELKYSMLSVYYNTARKVPLLCAYNIDGALPKSKIKRLGTFRADPRVHTSFQLNEEFYDLVQVPQPIEFHVGHMASHNEMSWGVDASRQAQQTFFYTNSVPQVAKLNGGLWSKLESYVIDETNDAGNKRIAVFTGPMLADTDPDYKHKEVFQVNLSLIEEYTDLQFFWPGVNRVEIPHEQNKLRRIAQQQDSDLAHGLEKAAPKMQERKTNIILPNN